MQGGGTAAGDCRKTRAQFFIAAGRGGEPVQQGSKIKACSPSYHGQSTPALQFLQYAARHTGVLAGSEVRVRTDNIYKMMRNAQTSCWGHLSGADIEAPIDLHRVTVQDLSRKGLSEMNGQIAFARAGGTKHRN